MCPSNVQLTVDRYTFYGVPADTKWPVSEISLKAEARNYATCRPIHRTLTRSNPAGPRSSNSFAASKQDPSRFSTAPWPTSWPPSLRTTFRLAFAIVAMVLDYCENALDRRSIAFSEDPCRVRDTWLKLWDGSVPRAQARLRRSNLTSNSSQQALALHDFSIDCFRLQWTTPRLRSSVST